MELNSLEKTFSLVVSGVIMTSVNTISSDEDCDSDDSNSSAAHDQVQSDIHITKYQLIQILMASIVAIYIAYKFPQLQSVKVAICC